MNKTISLRKYTPSGILLITKTKPGGVYMFFKSFTDGNLAQNSYLVGCQRTGEAIIIDPPRDFAHILLEAKNEGLHVIAAADTHIHADYISGARQLAVAHGARLYLSDEGDANWKYAYTGGIEVELVKESSKFSIGNIDFEVWQINNKFIYTH